MAAPTPPPTTPAAQATGKATPALGRDRPMAWLILAALLTVAVIPMYMNLRPQGSVTLSDTPGLELAVETWRTRHTMYQGEISPESMAPAVLGQPQLDQPPGIVWLRQISFWTLDPLTAENQDFVYHSRRLTAFCGLLTLAAVFWAGFSVGGLTTASFSCLVCLACPILIYYARSGTPDIVHVGFQTLSIAAAMWALRPLRPTPSLSRQGLGWGVCGAAMGVAVLSAGPVAVPTVILPILIISIMCPNRISHLMGLIASVFIASLMVMPWALYVHGQDPHTWERWVQVLWPKNLSNPGALWHSVMDRGLLIGVLVLPWTLWLIGSLAQPYSASSSGVRRRVFIGWAWFLCVTVLLLTGPGEGHLGGLLLALPPAVILIGQCLRLYSDLSAEARHARIWRVTRWPHLVLLALASVAWPCAMYFQTTLVQQGWLPRAIAAPMPWYYWLGLAVSLLMIWAMSLRFAIRHYPGRTLVCWSMWAIVLISVSLIPLTRGPLMNQPHDTPAPPPPNQAAIMPAQS